MKFSGYILCLGLAATIGCSDSEPEIPKSPAPPPAPVVETTSATTTTAASKPEVLVTALGDVEPELKPIQMAIQSFEAQNKRMPMNVEELVSSGAIQSLPPPPAGKIYFIDQGTKRIRLGGKD